MGITFSDSPHRDKESIIRLSYNTVEKVVNAYCTYQLPPILDENGYKFFIMVALNDLKDDNLARQLSQAYWEIYSDVNHS